VCIIIISIIILVNVIFAAPPTFTIPIENQFIDAGQIAEFRCFASGIPAVSYMWYVNSTVLTLSMLPPTDRDRYTFSATGNILTITGVRGRDAGMYQCQAKNTHGIRLCSAELRIFGTICLLNIVTQTNKCLLDFGSLRSGLDKHTNIPTYIDI